MANIILNCGKHHKQYRVIAEYFANNGTIALAGFCAQEQMENLLFKHLQNICVQSDGSLSSIHKLLCGIMQQWQSAFSIPAWQTLNTITNTEKPNALCLYKTTTGENEKLINRILM